MFGRQRWVVQDAESGAEGGNGGGGGEAATPAPADASAPASAPAAATPATAAQAPASVLAKANEDEAAKYHHTPEKYRVFGEDGAFDLAATLEKTAKAHADLETRMGKAGGTVPNAPGDYALNLPDTLADTFDQEDPGLREFLTEAHKAGFTQKQIDVAMAAFGNTVTKVIGGERELQAEECTARLSEEWADPAERGQHMRAAYRALKAFTGERFADFERDYGNDPGVIWLMAQVGAQMNEDTMPGNAGASVGSRSMADVVKDLGSADAGVRAKAEAEYKKITEAMAAKADMPI